MVNKKLTPEEKDIAFEKRKLKNKEDKRLLRK